MSVLENNANRSSSSVISHPHGSEQEDSDEDERLSVAPGSQEGEFSSGEEAETPVQVSQNVSQPSVPVSLPPSEIGRPTLKDLRDSVYTIMRDVNKVPFQSPRPKRLASTFEASCGMSQDTSKSHTSFPQSNHISNSLQIINDRIVANESHCSKVSGFGLAFLVHMVLCPLPSYCFLCRSEIQDGRHRRT